MAERRMFSKSVIDSDRFMNLPFSAQAVYLQFSMHADDDGFLGNAKRILRMIGGSEEDYNILVKQGYIREFESSVVAVVHWKINNYIQKDRYKPSVYRKERALMYPEFENNKEENSSVYNSDTQVSTGKDSTDKVSTGKDSTDKDSTDKDSTDKDSTDKVSTGKDSTDKHQVSTQKSTRAFGVSENVCEKIIDLYNRICTSLVKVQGATDDRKRNIDLLLKSYTPQQIEEVFSKAQNCDFLCGKGKRGWTASFDWLIREDNFLRVYEGVYDCRSKPCDESEPSYDLDEYERKSSAWIDNWQG